MYLKAQSSIEYLAVVGFGLLMATPFIGIVQQDVINLRTDSQDARFTSSLDEMESAISRADALGESAQTSFTLNVPENIEEAKVIGDRNIVFTQNRSGKLTNYTRLLDSNVSAISLPTERGRYRFTAQSSGGEVVLKYNEFIADFRALDPIIVGNDVTLQDESRSSRKVIDTREWYVNSSLELSGSETFSYTFSDSQVYNVSLKIAATDGSTDQLSKLYKAEESEVLAFSVESQSEWNLGTFSRTSADRNNNSGNLGLGYLNGTNPSATNLEEGLQGYWRLDGSSAKDYSGNGNDGTTNNFEGDELGVSGTFNTSSFNFDGSDDYVTTTNNEDITNNFPFAISLWVYDKGQLHSPYNTVMATFNSAESATGFLIFIENSNPSDWAPSFYYVDGNNVDWVYAPASSWNQDQWNHIVVVKTGSGSSNQKIYVNGAESSSSASNEGASEAISDDPPYLGYQPGTDREFHGKIDEVRIYNRSLSTSEVKDLYFNGRPFEGNYTAEKIDNSQETGWEKIEVNASVPSDTSLTAGFEALDSSDNLVDREYISVDSGDENKNYSLNIQASENGRLSFNGSSSNVTKTWKVYDYRVYSGG